MFATYRFICASVLSTQIKYFQNEKAAFCSCIFATTITCTYTVVDYMKLLSLSLSQCK